MRPARVLVTRPAPDAQHWVGLLQARGLHASALPLIDIVACAPAAAQLEQARRDCATPGHYRAVMFVSGNAVQFFFDQPQGAQARIAPPARAWSPGPGTARALQAAGVPARQIDGPPADAAQFDSEALWPEVRAQIQPGDRVLIVRGSQGDSSGAATAATGQGREWLADQLRQAGAALDFIAVYQRRAPRLAPQAQAMAQEAACDGTLWLFSSSEAVANLQQALPGTDWSQARALATHPRIAAAAQQAGFGLVQECRPSLNDVVASIESAP
ncbi:uroporphyrinogen-III synthase [Pantoea sp. 18069]|uniref:uroporphyrinogen-III synthase n=1 Tax=Pantoea sp. 18069 TaxID=2681415 RepID=UPI001357DAF9|nr:uroporphyrinogen-III synthase [Pantoea sp. 18069]